MRRAWAFLNRWFHWIALVGVTVGLLLAVRSQWPAISELDWAGSWKTIALSAVCFSLAPLAQASTSWIILRLLGARAPFGETMVIWAHSYVLRYAPSGALAIVYRVRERDRVRASREQILASEGYELLGSMIAGACALLLGFGALGRLPPLLGLVIAIPVIVVGFAVRPRFFGRWAQAFLRRRGIDTPILRGRHLIVVVAVNLVAWIATGLGFLVLLNGLSDESSPGLIWAMASYAVGYLVGFVVPFLPGGLGARESALVAVLSPRYGFGAATGIALVARLAVTLGETLAVGGIWLAYVAARGIRRLARVTGEA